ncbi:MAG: hypothetical protein H6703_11410 [Myxococcales bacterium]|nr:hypothetical protein [Myxococcales bacterium]
MTRIGADGIKSDLVVGRDDTYPIKWRDGSTDGDHATSSALASEPSSAPAFARSS